MQLFHVHLFLAIDIGVWAVHPLDTIGLLLGHDDDDESEFTSAPHRKCRLSAPQLQAHAPFERSVAASNKD